jgi:hypothetical protein
MGIESAARRVLWHKLKLWEAMDELEREFTDGDSDLFGLNEAVDCVAACCDPCATENFIGTDDVNALIAEICKRNDLKDPRCECDREVTGPVPNYCRIHDGDYSSWLALHNID